MQVKGDSTVFFDIYIHICICEPGKFRELKVGFVKQINNSSSSLSNHSDTHLKDPLCENMTVSSVQPGQTELYMLGLKEPVTCLLNQINVGTAILAVIRSPFLKLTYPGPCH